MTGLGNGVYQDGPGTFYVRPVNQGRRTWRKLASITARDAKVEASEVMRAVKMADLGIGKNPLSPPPPTVLELVSSYLAHHCPSKRLEERDMKFCEFQAKRLEWIAKWWGSKRADTVRLAMVHEYRDWRKPQIANGKGHRMIDMELQCLSNVLNYAVATGRLDTNFLLHRPRFQAASEVSHCRDAMPRDGDELNWWAELFFSKPETEVLGWQLLLEAMTGCRTSEVLALRWTETPGEAGYTWGNRIDLARLKGGVNPWAIMHEDLESVYEQFAGWGVKRYPESDFWLPNRLGDGPVSRYALTSHLARETASRGLPKRTSHGLRAYFVTKMRRDGYSDADVAAMIGDSTVSLIQTTYGKPRPGEPKLSFRRSNGTASWEEFKP